MGEAARARTLGNFLCPTPSAPKSFYKRIKAHPDPRGAQFPGGTIPRDSEAVQMYKPPIDCRSADPPF